MFKYLTLEIVKATVTLFCRLLHNQISTHWLLRRLRHLAPESKFVFNEIEVEDILSLCSRWMWRIFFLKRVRVMLTSGGSG